MVKNSFSNYFFIAMFLVILVLFFLILKIFLVPLFLAIVFTAVFYPIYRMMENKLKKPNLSAAIMCILLVFVIVIPMFSIVNALYNEATQVYVYAKEMLEEDSAESILEGYFCREEGFVCQHFRNYIAKIDTSQVITKLYDFIAAQAANVINRVASILFNIAIMFLCMFFFFRDGKKIIRDIARLIPLSAKHKKIIIEQFADICHATVYGVLVTALVQGVLGGIGFVIFQISNPVLWGAMMTLFAVFPFGGTFIIWMPAGIIQLFMGNYFSGIGIIIYGALIVGTIDNFLKPKIIGSRAKLSTLLVFLSVLGGMAYFGFVGVLIGPMIAALLHIFIKIYKLKYHGTLNGGE